MGSCELGVIMENKRVRGPDYNYKGLDDGGLGYFIYNSCQKFPSKTYQVCYETGVSESFGSFNKRSLQLASAMQKFGVRKHDVIVTCTKNNIDSTVPSIAAIYLGAVSAPLDPSLSVRDTIHLLKLVEPKMVFVSDEALNLVEDSLEHLDFMVKIVVIGATKKHQSFANFIKGGDASGFTPLRCDGDDGSFIMFSSGTTGLPKGIHLTHKSIYLGGVINYHLCNCPATLTHISSLYWVSAIMALVGQFTDGSKKVLLNNFNGETFLDAVDKHKINSAFLASLLAYKLVDIQDINKYDVTSFKTLVLGGGPLASHQMEKVRELLPNTCVMMGYGLTELSGYATKFLSSEYSLALKLPNSCGRPVTGTTIKVVDTETGVALGPNKSGEIRIDSISIMKGYYKQDSADAVDSEGYLKTGDIGYYDENGCFYVCDRIKDMFKYQSWHIVPASIESVLKEHPNIKDAVVFPIPAEQDENLPAAVVALKSNAETTKEEILTFVQERVLDRQRLRGGVYFMDEIPKTPTQKINRKKVQELMLEILKQ